VAYGLMMHNSLEAAQRLQEEEGVSVEVVDVRTISPLDKETILESVRKTGKAMVIYEDNRTYGAGAEISATIGEELMFDLDAPVVRMGGPDVPAMPFAGAMEHFFMPDVDKIYARMRALARFCADRKRRAGAPPARSGRYELAGGGLERSRRGERILRRR